MPEPVVRAFDTKDAFVAESVALLKDVVEDVPGANIGLSGGKTPRPVYEAFARSDVDMSETNFFVVDERYVPKTDPQSNERMIREAFGSRPMQLQNFDTKLDIESSLADYAAKLPSDPFDLLILGMGSDGHVASLFAGAEALDEAYMHVAHTTTDRFAVHDRLTMTFVPLLKADQILLLLSGEQKKAVLDRLLDQNDDPHVFPAMRLFEHEDVIIHITNDA